MLRLEWAPPCPSGSNDPRLGYENSRTLQPSLAQVGERLIRGLERIDDRLRFDGRLRGDLLPPISFPGCPERWWGDEALKAETDAPQATLEQ